MNIEVLEHELSQLGGKEVVIVRKGFGSQSDSFLGFLNKPLTDFFPLQFHFSYGPTAIMFTADDVLKIDSQNNKTIIRLKGPTDYVKPMHETYQSD